MYTDHKPLTTIFGSKRGVPPLAAARLQRWSLFLSSYSYDIEFKSTTAHANADCLSRLPLSTTTSSSSSASIFMIRQIEALPVTDVELRSATRSDVILSKVLRYTKSGWPASVPDTLKPYFYRKNELTLEEDCILWGARVVVPKKLQERVLNELHVSHLGIAKSKALARCHVWWPKIDSEIESLVRSCRHCQANQATPPVAPLHPWLWPSRPWQRLHIDFAGPFQGRNFLVVVDAHSKWPEVIVMSSTTASATIRELRRLFASFGLPEQLVSDNGPQFVSEEFQSFLKANRVKHLRSAPYHPSSNGLAERFVRTFKQALKASESSSQTYNQRLMSFLLSYRTTPHSTTGMSPSQLFLGRSIRTRLDLLHPSVSSHVTDSQAKQKKCHDAHARSRDLCLGQRVYARNYRPGSKWVPGTLVARRGPLSFVVQVHDGIQWHRHVDQLVQSPDSPQDFEDSSQPFEPISSSSDSQTDRESTNADAQVDSTDTRSESPTSPPRRYPLRNRRPPLRFSDEYSS